MHVKTYRLWPRRPRDGNPPLGFSCDEEGLALAGACPLVAAETDRAGRKRYRARPLAEINALLSAGYGVAIDAADIYPALERIARYLTHGERTLAGIAALHLRLPDLPDVAAARKVTAADALLKDWDPAKHPRAESAPNPG